SGQVRGDRRRILSFIFARFRPSPEASKQGVFTTALSQSQDTRRNSKQKKAHPANRMGFWVSASNVV
ncbi:MAG: hypothetical protein SF339_17705, partial [Blastocatellia bacterium]|nr:hypothetical protein [Blastocatellia bacterium]